MNRQDFRSISRTRTTCLFRAVKIRHLRCSNEGLRSRQIATANGSTPYRPAVVPVVWLQNVLLILVVRLYSRADIADWDGKGAFPAWTLAPGFAHWPLSANLTLLYAVMLS